MNIIDIHTHGLGGFDTRTTVEDHILRIAELHGLQGVTEILPAVYPATIKVMRENMAVIKNAMEKQNASLSGAARIIGLHLEGPFLNPAKCGALNAMTFLEPSDYRMSELIEGFEDIIRIVTVSPELEGAPGLIKSLVQRGIIVSMGHSDATYAETEAGFRAGATGITHIFNAMRGYHHREPGIAGFGLLNRDVYIEVIADLYHLHPATLELVFRVKNPDRIVVISDSVRVSGLYAGKLAAADNRGRLLGGCLPVTEAIKGLLEKGYEEEMLMKCISENPERYLMR
jgi:N-acetylglucosamine-6-phosphate deacetylase